MYIIGIETSCDETAAAVVKDGVKILSNEVASSINLHREFGGVIPEIAARAHVESIGYVVENALKRAGVELAQIELIAVTRGPGLVGALLIGISFAKALSLAREIPLIGVNHVYAHIWAGFLEEDNLKLPLLGLAASGGHTTLIYIENIERPQLIGRTLDDAAGEAFDKVAKILGLGYPGGQVIDEIARGAAGNTPSVTPGYVPADKVFFTRPYINKENFNFSFSGIKTAVLYYVKKLKEPLSESKISAIAAGFQEVVVEALVRKTLLALDKYPASSVVVGGGVAANSHLREAFQNKARQKGFRICFPSRNLCVDNAAMIAALGHSLYEKGHQSELDLTVEPNLDLGGE